MSPLNDDDENLYSENIQRILDIELPLTVSFGSASWPLKEILSLKPGTVLELDKTADEPVILRVNNKSFAKGEVVVVDGFYGIKIQEITPPQERIASLGR